ncbi:hypothetical protein ACIQM4_25895 [Streptomyces sp. NPDC091272]|uniref:hypothetical protein n=1 Tax=Streptomyces sp. NPDC091272 TaxID=3365981 RepID=UPI0037F243F6
MLRLAYGIARLEHRGEGLGLTLGAFFGFQFIVTLHLQELRGWSSLRTAIALSSWAVTPCWHPPSPPPGEPSR